MLNVTNLIEVPRLNGYRQTGQPYLAVEKVNYQCCRLPFQLTNRFIPTAGLVALPAEFTSNGPAVVGDVKKSCIENNCSVILPAELIAGMMWVNESDYEFASYWFGEARTMTMFLNAGPILERKRCLGKYILLAHRKAIVDYSNGPQAWVDSETGKAHTNVKYFPGIFALVKVIDVQYVIGDRRPNAKMKQMYQRMQDDGHSLVNILRDEELKKTKNIEKLKFTR